MKKSKEFMIIIALVFCIFMIPSIVKATEISVTKNVPTTDGSINFVFGGLDFIEGDEYKFAIEKSKTANPTVFYNLTGTNVEKKETKINLDPTVKEHLNILKETDIAYIFIKNISKDTMLLDGYRVDLTLPLLKSFTVTRSTYNSVNPRYYTKGVYGITSKNIHYNFVKITDENFINEYRKEMKGNKDLSKLNLATINDCPSLSNSNWVSASTSDGVAHNQLPKEEGLYYLWLMTTGTDTKTIYGYTIIDELLADDTTAPTVTKIEVVSPSSGTYKTSQTVKIRVCFSEKITGTTVPTLKIKFGESAVKEVSNGTIKDDYIEYSYNIQDSDKGQLATVSLTGGTIKDNAGNDANLSCPIISGNTIKANVEGTTTNNTNNQDTTNTDKTNTNNNNTNNNNNSNSNNNTNNNTNNKPTGTTGNNSNNSSNSSSSTTTTNKDTTTATGKIPQTGEGITVFAVASIVIGLAIFGYIRYNKYRDI